MNLRITKLFTSIFNIYKENGRIIIKIFGLKITFKNPLINPLTDFCNIPDLKRLKENNTAFPHPVGIVIAKSAIIGRNCTIFQNVTIGEGGKTSHVTGTAPSIDDNVTIYANSVIIGGIHIGKNSVIGAGSVVIKDVPDNVTVAGNPARIIKRL